MKEWKMIKFNKGEKLTIKVIEDNREFSVVVLREDEGGRFLRCIGIDLSLNEASMFISCENNELVDVDNDITYKIKSIKALKISSDSMRERLELVK